MHKSVWDESVSLPHFPALKKSTKTDVLIIGGGITGILTAYFLKSQGVDCILVEKGRICSGTTHNTTGKITYGHGLIYDKIIKSHGLEIAKGYLLANKAALEKYAELTEGIDCDFEYRDNYVYSKDDRQKIEKEVSALEKLGERAEFCESLKIPVKTVGGVKLPGQAQFNPLKFLAHIAKDLKIYENTFVREMVKNIACTDKAKIFADKVIVTTHFPFINKHGSYFLKLYQHRSYVIGLEGAGDVHGMYVDEDKTGLSFRNYGTYLLLGGGGHRTGKSGGNWGELRDFAKAHYPEASERFFWAAQDCMSLDGMPYIGKYSSRTQKLYTASGFNKWGMTGAMVSAMLLCDEVCGKKNEYVHVFDPSRSILHPQLIVNGFETTKNLLTPTTKRCPHLGCALKYNRVEHSWDCQCHGSRLTENGKVLDNPANGPAD